MRWARLAGAYCGLVFGAGFVLGAVRVPLLVPRLGVRAAELLEMPVMLGVIVCAARWVVRRAPAASRGERLAVGLGALLLLAAAELGCAFAFAGLDPLAYVRSRDPVSGGVYAGALAVFALLPACWPAGRTRPGNDAGPP